MLVFDSVACDRTVDEAVSMINDRPGIVHTLMDIIRENDGRLGSIMTSYDDTDEGFRKIFLHTFDLAPDLFDPVVGKMRQAADMIYAADQERDRKIIF